MEGVRATATASKGLKIGMHLHEEVPRRFLLNYMKEAETENEVRNVCLC